MKVKAVLTGLLVLTALGGSGIAERISIKGHNPDQVAGHCNGTTWPKTGANSTYGCMNEDGSGIVCGGVSASDKKTCDTFFKLPPRLVRELSTIKAGEPPASKQ